MRITFTVDQGALERIRCIELVRGTGRYAIPADPIYQPVQKFLNTYSAGYPFAMMTMLHAAAVKMLALPLKIRPNRTLFATGGLYLALDQSHADLKIHNTFGDFTSGFSHQFGVALSVMCMSQAFGISWDQLVPIPVKGQRVLDYQSEIPGGGWLQLESKGVTSDSSRTGARLSAYRKKLIDPNNITSPKHTFSNPTAMIGVIVQAARTSTKQGMIEIIDPDFNMDPTARRAENQLAGRYLHYAGVARFAGLYAVAQECVYRAMGLVQHQERSFRARTLRIRENIASVTGGEVVGVQWRVGDGVGSDDDIWFQHGFEVSRLRRVIEGRELPSSEPFHAPAQNTVARRGRDGVVESMLPDGSYFAISYEPHYALRTIDPRETNLERLRIVEVA